MGQQLGCCLHRSGPPAAEAPEPAAPFIAGHLGALVPAADDERLPERAPQPSATVEAPDAEIDGRAGAKPALAPPATETPMGKKYAAFVSHFKAEAAMEARFLMTELESALGRSVFLDSDDLSNLQVLKDAVAQSEVIVLIQSRGVLERPWCLIEILTALELGILTSQQASPGQ